MGATGTTGETEDYWIMMCIGLLPAGESLFRNSIQERAESVFFCAATRISRIWVQGVRDTYRKGKLSQERIAKLNEIGFEFLEGKKLTPWEERFRELTEYKK
eukprot:scaffold14560_cov23-Cyclotella_meneghiniana.AAC.1